MSEQNILNPSTTSPMNPDYATPIKLTDPQVVARWQARSGKPYFRRLAARALVWDLTWTKRLFSEYQALRQWFYQYENDYFTFADYDDNPTRYYTGMFADQPTHSREAFNQVTVNAQFVVVPTLPLYQYPSNWNADAIFLEERTGFGDLVKLTGSNWDHRDKNYLLWSEDFTQSAWSKTNITVTANATAAPDGTLTADKVAATASTFTNNNQTVNGVGNATGNTYSIYAKQGTGATTANNFLIRNNTTATNLLFVSINYSTGVVSLVSGTGTFSSVNAGNGWWRIVLTVTSGVSDGDSIECYAAFPGNSQTAGDFAYVWGAQLEQAASASTFTFTTSAPVQLTAPVANPFYHGGSAYFDIGTNVADAAEWLYFGYGFQLWSYKGPSMGIASLFLDGVSLGLVDMYAAAPTASAVVYSLPNIALGIHRFKIEPTDTKNAASAAFYVSADALQVMR